MKIRNYFLLFIAVITIQSCSQEAKKDDKATIISKLENTLRNYQSAHFKVDEKYYSTDVPDTTNTPFEVWIARDAADSSQGGFIWADNNYRPYNLIFAHDSFLVVIPPKKTTLYYPVLNEPIIGEHDWLEYFLKPQKLTAVVNDSNNRIKFSEIELEGKKFFMLDIDFPVNKKGTQTSITYMIDEQTAFPVKAKLVRKSPGKTLTNELTFSDFDFDKVALGDLKERRKKVLADNPIEVRENSTTALVEKMLHEGDDPPLFSGLFYNSTDSFHLQDYIGKKVIILDFWYTHCPPCVRAIPHLSDFYAANKDKGLIIFGLNSVDNQPRAMDNLNKFLAKRDISYPIILTQPEVDKKYKILGYPSMYVIGLDGKIAIVEVGFDKEHFEKMKEEVLKLLQ